MPAGLMRDVGEQRPKRFAANIRADTVVCGLPDEGIGGGGLTFGQNAEAER